MVSGALKSVVNSVIVMANATNTLVDSALSLTPIRVGQIPYVDMTRTEHYGAIFGSAVPIAADLRSGPVAFGVSPKIAKQMPQRGWTADSVQDVLSSPSQTLPATNKATGGGATAYFDRTGAYVVRDNRTGAIIQVGDRNNPNWIPDSAIIMK